MTRFNLFMAKHLHKRIQGYKKHRDNLNAWIKRDRIDRQHYLNKLDLREYMQFGADTGYVSKDKKKR